VEEDRDVVKQIARLALVTVAVISGCRAVESPDSVQTAVQNEAPSFSIIVDALDNSIPLGDNFPIVVNLANAEPNSVVDIELDSEGIMPSVKRTSVSADDSGRATLRITGVASRAQLTVLQVKAFNEGLETSELLLVDFTPPQTTPSLAAQNADEVVGEPTTYTDYIQTLPTVTSFDEVQAVGSSPEAPDVVFAKDVAFPDDSGELIEPIDALIFDTNSAEDNLEVQMDLGTKGGGLSALACESTYITLKSKVASTVVNMPASTKVVVSTPSGSSTKWVQAGGRLNFDFCGSGNLQLSVFATSSHGLYMHTQYVPYGPTPQIIWEHSRSGATADGLRGDVIQMSADTEPFLSRATQRIWYLMNIVRNWELSAHDVYDSHSVDLIFPAQIIGSSRAAVGQIWLKGGDYDSAPTIFHEYGHEVYYRRVIGGPLYEHLHREAVAGGASLPACIGELWAELWEVVDGCTAMLEGFALWFESITLRALDAHPTVAPRALSTFNPETRPSAPMGAAVPGRVAQHLVDLSDVDTGYTDHILRDGDDDPFVRAMTALDNPQLDAKRRYAYVAGLFYDGPVNQNFSWYWRYNFMPVLASGSETTHCATMKFNTLGGIYGCQ
jgi:hypothetical protein